MREMRVMAFVAAGLLLCHAGSAVAAIPNSEPKEAAATISAADGEGRVTVDVDLGPALFVPAYGDVVRRWYFALPAGYRIVAVNTFYGVDRGNAQESLIEVASGQSPAYRLYQRSPHKESNSVWESWERREVRYALAEQTSFTVYCLTRATNRVAGGHVQFGLRLELEPLTPR